jgi:hypothetical protein
MKSRKLVELVRDVIQREKGQGTKLVKVHHTLHISDDIRMFGSAKNFHGGRPESHHTQFCKETAGQTQKRYLSVEGQTASRYSDNHATDLAYYMLHPDRLVQTKSQRAAVAGKHFIISFAPVSNLNSRPKNFIVDWKDKKRGYRSPTQRVDPPEHILRILACKVDGQVQPDASNGRVYLHCFTEHTRPETEITFRASTSFQGGPWNDWANFEWEGIDDPVPARMELFVDFKEDAMTEDSEYEAGPHVLIQSLAAAPDFVKGSTIIQHSHFPERDSGWYLVPVETIHSPAVVVPDVAVEPLRRKNLKERHLVLRAPSAWLEEF